MTRDENFRVLQAPLEQPPDAKGSAAAALDIGSKPLLSPIIPTNPLAAQTRENVAIRLTKSIDVRSSVGDGDSNGGGGDDYVETGKIVGGVA